MTDSGVACPYPGCDLSIPAGEHAEVTVAIHLIEDHPVWSVPATR